MIVILDYGMGNLNSVKKALKRIEVHAEISNDAQMIEKADKLLLPGVGNFELGMENLRKNNLIDLLNEQVLEKQKPILGICLGMQLLTSHSEEGDAEGLNWIPGKTIEFKKDMVTEGTQRKLKVPHIGWNTLKLSNNQNNLLSTLPNNTSQYFVHSYYVKCDNEENVMASTEYGHDFHSSISKDNIYGTQFHPEKSHKMGLEILRNFSNL